MTKNPIVHWEILGTDADEQRSFYSTVFDWEPAGVEGFPNYFMVQDDGIGVSGAIGTGPEEMPSYSCVYVGVEDINETLAVVEANGGAVVMPRTEIPDVVIFGMFTDPAGNLVGITEGD